LFYLLGWVEPVLQAMQLLGAAVLVCSTLWDRLQGREQAQRPQVWLAAVLFLLPQILTQQMGAESVAVELQSASCSQWLRRCHC
jgi:ABC-type uncharacterized transport system permease subunit